MVQALPQPRGALSSRRKPTHASIALHKRAPRALSVDMDHTSYEWTGEDEFSDLEDRKAEAPLPLPPLTAPKRIVLVRHGQSTWNAEGRIQGSTDFATLSIKGQEQAQTSSQMLEEEVFDKLFHSPLKRASETASIVWGGTVGPTAVLPSLREIDLYSFQGLLKAEGKARFGAEFDTWQRAPAQFEIDGQKPVRELWYRASLAWREILLDDDVAKCALVVAHNAVNQALVATAIGVGPEYFRRLLQSNAASTVLDFLPRGPDAPPVVTIDRLNQSPGREFVVDDPGAAHSRKRVFLVRHAATVSTEDNLLPTSVDEPVSSLGEVQAVKLGEFLMDTRIDTLLVSPAERAVFTASAIAKCQSLTGDRAPRLQMKDELENLSMGGFAGQDLNEVQQQGLPADAENLSDFWQRTGVAWRAAHAAATGQDGGAGGTTCIVAHAAVHAALVCHCLGLSEKDLGRFRMSTAGLTVIEFPFSDEVGVVRCHNYTAHLGRWAVPISRDNEVQVCGIDGCF